MMLKRTASNISIVCQACNQCLRYAVTNPGYDYYHSENLCRLRSPNLYVVEPGTQPISPRVSPPRPCLSVWHVGRVTNGHPKMQTCKAAGSLSSTSPCISLPESSFSAQAALSSWGAGPRLPLLWNPSKPPTLCWPLTVVYCLRTLNHIIEFFRPLLLHLNLKVVRHRFLKERCEI